MKKGLWHKRIPTLLALLILFISIFTTTLLIQTGVIFIGQATPDKTPKGIETSNVNDSSFSVSFTTNDKTTAALSIMEEGEAPTTILDDTASYSHHITAPGLSEGKSYQFLLLIDGQTFSQDGEKYKVLIAPKIVGNPYKQNSISGDVILPNGSVGNDTIVELDIPGAQKLTALTSDDGKYSISTTSIRTGDLKSYLNVAPDTEITIKFIRQDLISTVKSKFKNAFSLPTATLSYAYDFSKIESEEVATAASLLEIPVPEIKSGKVKITNPRDGQAFVDNRPRFTGTSLPNSNVKITIKSEPIIVTVKSDTNGLWSFRPTSSLSPGPHKIIIEARDGFGITKTLTINFTVFAQGSQIAESATPSATPSITQPIPTSTLPTKTPGPTQPIPTDGPTIAPTFTPAPTPIIAAISPTTASIVTPPPPGSNSLIILTLTSVLLIFAGSAFLFIL